MVRAFVEANQRSEGRRPFRTKANLCPSQRNSLPAVLILISMNLCITGLILRSKNMWKDF